MINEKQKNEILALVDAEKQRLGSYAKVASKCAISETVLSQLRSGTYPAESDTVWFKIAAALDYDLHAASWRFVEIANSRLIKDALLTAKNKSLFIGISHRAGSSKTATTRAFDREFSASGSFRLQCREWSRRDFLYQVCRLLGIDTERRSSIAHDTMIQEIADFFNARTAIRPILILDEADKLKPTAIRVLIPLFNECESRLGVVICGTDNLEKEFKSGTRYNLKGYDELNSRFGRKFIHLPGATEGDIAKICTANGIKDNKAQRAIFEECEPISTFTGTQQVKVVHDLRRVRRVIERELIKQNKPMEAATA